MNSKPDSHNLKIRVLFLTIAFVLDQSALAQDVQAEKDKGAIGSPTEPQKSPAPASVSDEEKKSRDDAYKKGAALFQAKKYKEALPVLEKAAASPQDDGEARILLGYTYYGMKKYPQALKEYRTASEKGKLISIRNRAARLAQTLDSYIRGICPGNCLKPSMPGWRKMNVPGKPDRLVWMVYPYLDPAGKGGSEYWSNDHMGEVIEYVNGRPINKGKCPICQGTGRVSLP